ncbi:dTDP-4-dehydrorhamnose reductase [Catenuloplanes nepalensis]|uniref:dTDP-4-dehydrorhamnose reductase n=1 Tax=Catenuloplanes nepalensis TaxID=587533 RepID=A0ABT9MW78_9ACTN|nr:dTDP-4-dehydrorhamnose reductase [Catenuloplanes nepalensis]MDP9795704.1 dTDP-4-dehydrorhamnose reductase [Catenuloplanes nepalensis]
MTRWLITGAGGMLGRDLVAALTEPTASYGRHARRSETPVEITAATRDMLDVTDAAAVASAVSGHDIVINAAAWTDVDAAEDHEDVATDINGRAVNNLAAACTVNGAKLIQISTDYVFDGTGTKPYPETHPTAPINAYGRGKVLGEQLALRTGGYVVRTAWLYGDHGPNFIATMLKLAASRPTVDVVTDQIGQPTWTAALAEQLVRLGTAALAGTAAPGIYHGTATGQASWHDLARTLYDLAGLDPDRIRPTTAESFARPAPRPAYSVLGHDAWTAAGIPPQPDWRVQLDHALSEPGFADLAKAARS